MISPFVNLPVMQQVEEAVIVDRRPNKKAFRVPPPRNKLSLFGRSMYAEASSQQEALKFFNCNQAVGFDVLYPIFVPPRGRRFCLTSSTTSHYPQVSARQRCPPPPRTAAKKKNLTEQQRHQILGPLLQEVVGDNPRHGALGAIAAKFDVHHRTVSRIWQRPLTTAAISGVLTAQSWKRTTGRKKKNYDAALERLRGTAPETRSTVRAAARVCGVPAATLHRQPATVNQAPVQISPGSCQGHDARTTSSSKL
ncbi:hypothetical protein PHYPSEUDO_006696 [Phytophthora pseudosyringae]|uniref:DUF7769 domain-containing protein n=1 Tax=Phytophthora pseudosyringae TaxID=221518 RepID=A0A8T1VLF4_9STRA|nr:hypothetical protein PHYPSEUDO_006696 [Phytophthora pseudosyringae]